MMRKMIFLSVIGALLTLCGCSGSNLLIYKDAKHYYVTNKSDGLRKMLCDSGDLDRIAKDSQLPDEIQKELIGSICAGNKVKERVLAVLGRMTKEQRTALKLAFQLNGYEVNTIANC
jgi:hypothetical protein